MGIVAGAAALSPFWTFMLSKVPSPPFASNETVNSLTSGVLSLSLFSICSSFSFIASVFSESSLMRESSSEIFSLYFFSISARRFSKASSSFSISSAFFSIFFSSFSRSFSYFSVSSFFFSLFFSILSLSFLSSALYSATISSGVAGSEAAERDTVSPSEI